MELTRQWVRWVSMTGPNGFDNRCNGFNGCRPVRPLQLLNRLANVKLGSASIAFDVQSRRTQVVDNFELNF